MIKPAMIAIVRDGRLLWQYNSLAMWNASLEEYNGKWVEVSLRRCSRPKTQPELGYYYGVIVKVARLAMIDAGIDFMGVAPSDEMVDKIIKHYCCKSEVRDKRSMNSIEMGELINNSIRWLASTFNVVVPPPEGRKNGQL